MLKSINLYHTITVFTTSLLLSMSITACGKSTPQATQTNPKTTTSNAQTIANNQDELQKIINENLKKSGIQTQVESVIPTAMPNMYWAKLQGLPSVFVDGTGEYLIQGEMIKIGNPQPQNITSELLAQDSKQILSQIDQKDMIIFPAKGQTKGVIYAFTDADCGYCRKLHQEIDQTNQLGIEVRYLPWPRSQQTFPIMESIWCSKDRNTAMTQAKRGENIEHIRCDNPIQKIHDLGSAMGITGTPAIFTEDGQQLGGYLPSKALAEALKIQ